MTAPKNLPGLILIVDDEPAICWAFEKMLKADGHEVVSVSSAEDGLKFVERERPDLILLDVRLPGENGISALPRFLKLAAGTPVIVMTAFGDLETATSAIRNGASDYITKPFGLEEAQKSCNNALSTRGANTQSKTQQSSRPTEEKILVGKSGAIQAIFKQIALVARSDLSVLITGETGTGKELVAKAIHKNSSRHDKPYIPIAPVAFSPELIESELFGHVRGAFTGAHQDKAGVFELADGGTVLLDEIGDLPISLQVKLLRILDQKQYHRVGDAAARHCDVRILAATNCDLVQAVAKGTFREDLFYRLNGLCMQLPPLRERSDDIEILCEHFLNQLPYSHCKLSPSLVAQLRSRPWHGNVRELQNAVEHASIVARGRTLQIDDFPAPQAGRNQVKQTLDLRNLHGVVRHWCEQKQIDEENCGSGLLNELLAEVEPTLIKFAMEKTGGNRSKAATLLGIHRGTLRTKLKPGE